MNRFCRITWSELHRMAARRRTYIGFGAFLLFDLLVLIILNRPGSVRFWDQRMESLGVLFEHYFSGLTVAFVIISATAFLLAIPYLALVAGDVVAKELEDGNFRLILSRPVSRFELLFSKFLAVQCYTIGLVFFVGLSSYVTGSLVRGWTGGLFVLAPARDLMAIYSFAEGAWRYLGAVAGLSLCLTTVSSVGFLFSCTRLKPAAATIVTISLFFVDFVVHNLEFARDYRDWFLSSHTSQWLLLLESPIRWSDLIQTFAYLFGLSATCFILGWTLFENRDLKA